MATSSNELDVLRKELEIMRRQMEQEKQEKDFWKGKYMRLKVRYTSAFPSVRLRRNSRDEDETMPHRYNSITHTTSRSMSSIPTHDVSNASTIDLTTNNSPLPSREAIHNRIYNINQPTNLIVDNQSHPPSQPSWRRTSHSTINSTDTNDIPSNNIPARFRPVPRTLELEQVSRSIQPNQGMDGRNSTRIFRAPDMNDSMQPSRSQMANTDNNAHRSQGRHAISNNSTSRTTSNDPEEEASLALAMALQQEEVMRAHEEQAMIDDALETQRRNAHLANIYRIRGDLARSTGMLNTMDSGTHRPAFPDVDNMSHEELIRLGERMGDVKKERWRLRANQVISRLPCHRLKNQPSGDSKMCIICQEDYHSNDHVLTLPCAHIFHNDCVQEWIRENNACPTCKSPIEPEE